MSHSEKCPVCEGLGLREQGGTCQGCDGKGWVTVEDKTKLTNSKLVTSIHP